MERRMKNFVFVSGNLHKVHLLEKFLGQKVEHHNLDLHEIQSLDPQEIIRHKAKEAYRILKKPLLVDDSSLIFHAFNGLPGPFIRFFLETVGRDGMCKMLNAYDDRSATASIILGLYDGKMFQAFRSEVKGSISLVPKGDPTTLAVMGWNSIFIPAGQPKTYAEMDEAELFKYSTRNKAVQQLKTFLNSEKKS